jgi:hypothetical protein
MIERLRAQLAELRRLEAAGVEERSEHPGALSRADEIQWLRGAVDGDFWPVLHDAMSPRIR